MHKVAWSGLSLCGMLLSAGCSSTSPTLERGRSPVEGQGEQNAGETETSVAPVPSDAAEGYWTLVRSENSIYPFAEEWSYDAAARLVRARVLHFRRDINPYYAVDITLTYDGNHVTSVHDHEADNWQDLTYEYDLQSGRLVSYTVSAPGEVKQSQTYEYDAQGRLLGSLENAYGYESQWTLERNEAGEPAQLLKDGEVICDYSWRHIWLATKCYTDGVVTELYEADAAERLGRLTFEGIAPVVYAYDEAGRLTSQTGGAYTYEYRYSAEGKLLESRGVGNEEIRIYDDLGLLREVRSGGADVTTTTFDYERVSADEVIETESSEQMTIVRTYKRLSHPPTGEPQPPSYWKILRTEQPNRFLAPTDYSKVP